MYVVEYLCKWNMLKGMTTIILVTVGLLKKI